MRVLRYVWAFPTTLVGLVVALLTVLTGGRVQLVDGVLEVYGGAAAWMLRTFVPLAGGARAMALGHVVLGRNRASLEATRLHERVHVRQAERWGPFFIPAYLLASLWAFLTRRNPYLDNPFEHEAFAEEAAHRKAASSRSNRRRSGSESAEGR